MFQGGLEAFQDYSRGFKGIPGDFSGVSWVSGVFQGGLKDHPGNFRKVTGVWK